MARLQVTEARHRPALPARERRTGARHALATAVPVDPTIYEVLQVYGPTIKELIHEQFGDGIVSAISRKWSMSDAAGLFE